MAGRLLLGSEFTPEDTENTEYGRIWGWAGQVRALPGVCASGSEGWRAVAEVGLEGSGDFEHQLIGKGPAGDLHADGQAFGGLADGDDGGGSAEKIEPLRVAHGVEVGDGLALDGPAALAGAEGGDGANGAQQEGEGPHFVEELGADFVGADPGLEGSLGRKLHFSLRDGEEVAEGGAEIGFAAANRGCVEHGSALDEEKPPEFARGFKTGGPEGFDDEALALEGARGLLNGGAGFEGNWNEAVVFKVSDGDLPGFLARDGTMGDGSAVGVVRILTRKRCEEQSQVGDSACQGADGAEKSEGPEAAREMAGGGDASGGGLERADAGVMGGLADGTAAVTAESGRRKACGDGGCFAATRTTGGVFKVPGIARATAEPIFGLVGHEELGAVGGAEDDGAGREETIDDNGVFVGDESAIEHAADFATMASNGDG